MIGIQTKVLPATNYRGTRIKAFVAQDKWYKSVTIPYPHANNEHQAHFEAVKLWFEVNQMQTNNENMRYGSIADGYVFCFDASKVGEI
jgi:hypothetical protein